MSTPTRRMGFRRRASNSYIARNRPTRTPTIASTSFENLRPGYAGPVVEQDFRYRPHPALNDHFGLNSRISPFSHLCSLIEELKSAHILAHSIERELDFTLYQVNFTGTEVAFCQRLGPSQPAGGEAYFHLLDHLAHQYEAFRLVRKALTHREANGRIPDHYHGHEEGICPFLRELHRHLTMFRMDNQPTSIVSASLRYDLNYPQTELDGPLHVSAPLLSLRCRALGRGARTDYLSNADELARIVSRMSAQTIDDTEWEECSKYAQMLRQVRMTIRQVEELSPYDDNDRVEELPSNDDREPLQDITPVYMNSPFIIGPVAPQDENPRYYFPIRMDREQSDIRTAQTPRTHREQSDIGTTQTPRTQPQSVIRRNNAFIFGTDDVVTEALHSLRLGEDRPSDVYHDPEPPPEIPLPEIPATRRHGSTRQPGSPFYRPSNRPSNQRRTRAHIASLSPGVPDPRHL
ncbi:hypothetical protein HDK90DRAFT_349568 [Phyllosticta capitalensis]|uniref:Uncharacterized protein n=1 Tax=Phyllosticta capitalensis TaxID=121624 RepID=A0ABR1YGM2_9PEZI